MAKCIYSFSLGEDPTTSNPNLFISNIKNSIDQNVDLYSRTNYDYQNSGAQSRKAENSDTFNTQLF